jgi:hypothetical protein
MKKITRFTALVGISAGLLFSGSWESVLAVPAGQRVRVETAQMKQTGAFVAASADALIIRTGEAGQVEIARSGITRVYMQKRSNRLRNTLIGLGVGVAAGAVLYGTIGQIFRSEGAESGGFLAAPIAIGAAVGAALPTGGMKRIYDAGKDSGAYGPR